MAIHLLPRRARPGRTLKALMTPALTIDSWLPAQSMIWMDMPPGSALAAMTCVCVCVCVRVCG